MKLNEFQRKRLQRSLGCPDLSTRNHLRLQIILMIGEGKSQKEICQTLHCSPATVRPWIQVVKAGQVHRWEEFCQDGRPKTLTEQHRKRLSEWVRYHSPKDFRFAFDRWTAKPLQQMLLKEFGIEISTRHINRILRELGVARRSRVS
jgi:transposase